MKYVKSIISIILVIILSTSTLLAAYAEVSETETQISIEEQSETNDISNETEKQASDEDQSESDDRIRAEGESSLTSENMSDDEIINMLFENCYDVFTQYRNEVGIYRDSILLFDGTPYHPSSIAATGIGLMSLTIADKKGWNDNALEDARLTLRTMTGHTEGFKPDVSPNGFIRHFIDLETGEQAWDSEYSTIDTAILVTGALFAKKYFNDPELGVYVDELFNSIDFQDALASLDTGGMYMIMDADGKGNPNAITLPFNEYIIVAWLAYNQHIDESDSLAVKMWNKWFKTPENILKKDYQGISLLTDNVNRFLPSFTLLFPYYMVNVFSSSVDYEQYIENAYMADKLWSVNTGGQSYEWGNGAGNNRSTGYHADAINDNEELTVSPHIISGFIPINPSGRDDLLALYKNNKGVYQLPSNDKEILWRYSRVYTDWESDSIQAIDYSTFLFGLAAQDKDLGMNFFKDNNDFFKAPDGNVAESENNNESENDKESENNNESENDKESVSNKGKEDDNSGKHKISSVSVHTGDTTNIMIPITLLLLSACFAIILFGRKRIKKS